MSANAGSLFVGEGRRQSVTLRTASLMGVAEFPPRLSYFAKNLGNRTVDLFNH